LNHLPPGIRVYATISLEQVTSPLPKKNFNPKKDFPQQYSLGSFFEYGFFFEKDWVILNDKFNDISFQGCMYPEIHSSKI
jgi:hypothetical protein